MKQNKPYVIGLVGGSGSGKTSLAKILSEALEAQLIEGDQIGHSLLKDSEVMRQIQDAFGTRVIVNNQVDRSALGSIVFKDKEALSLLNRITHPKLYKEIRVAIQESVSDFIILDAAVMVEAGLLDQVDYLIEVIADYEIRKSRLIHKRGIPADKAEAMIKAYHKHDIIHASYVFDTSKDLDLMNREIASLVKMITIEKTKEKVMRDDKD